MKNLKKSAPVLASLNIAETVDFYREKLGFTCTWEDEFYAVLRRDDILIHFWKCEDKIFPENTGCYVYVSGVDELYAELTESGIIHPKGQLEDKPWGMREFAVLDLHGNLIRFGESL